MRGRMSKGVLSTREDFVEGWIRGIKEGKKVRGVLIFPHG